jgi:hypothetical protein
MQLSSPMIGNVNHNNIEMTNVSRKDEQIMNENFAGEEENSGQ